MLTHEQLVRATEYAAGLVSERPGIYRFHELSERVRFYMEREVDNFGILSAYNVIRDLTFEGKIRTVGSRYHPA